jgi:Type II secretion system (T2SS), protein E, N-terminal domain
MGMVTGMVERGRGMPRIGELLVSLGACQPRAIEEALQHQAFFGARIGTSLLQMGAVREAQLVEALEQLHGVPAVCGDVPTDPEVIGLVPRHLVEKYEVLPYMVHGTKLAVLARDPADLALDHIAFATGKKVFPFVVAEARLWSLMAKFYGIERGVRGIDLVAAAAPFQQVEKPASGRAIDDLMEESDFMDLYGSRSWSDGSSVARIVPVRAPDGMQRVAMQRARDREVG